MSAQGVGKHDEMLRELAEVKQLKEEKSVLVDVMTILHSGEVRSVREFKERLLYHVFRRSGDLCSAQARKYFGLFLVRMYKAFHELGRFNPPKELSTLNQMVSMIDDSNIKYARTAAFLRILAMDYHDDLNARDGHEEAIRRILARIEEIEFAYFGWFSQHRTLYYFDLVGSNWDQWHCRYLKQKEMRQMA